MPKLCEILREGVPCKVRQGDTEFKWDGIQLRFVFDNSFCVVSLQAFKDNWHLVEPTVESVMRERGYELCPLGRDFSIEPLNDQRPALRVFSDKKPVTVAQITAICDLLDQYKKPTEKAQ